MAGRRPGPKREAQEVGAARRGRGASGHQEQRGVPGDQMHHQADHGQLGEATGLIKRGAA